MDVINRQHNAGQSIRQHGNQRMRDQNPLKIADKSSLNPDLKIQTNGLFPISQHIFFSHSNQAQVVYPCWALIITFKKKIIPTKVSVWRSHNVKIIVYILQNSFGFIFRRFTVVLKVLLLFIASWMRTYISFVLLLWEERFLAPGLLVNRNLHLPTLYNF